MRERLCSLLVSLAWMFARSDWAFYAIDSYERKIWTLLTDATIAFENMREARRINWPRIHALSGKGTR